MKVSAIIPVHGAIHALRETAAAVSLFVPQPHEVIIVDDCADVCEVPEILRLCHKYQFRYIRTERRSWYPGAANLGVGIAESPISLILNSDTVPPEGIIANATKALAAEGVAAVGFVGNAAGYQSVPWNPNANGAYPVCKLPEGKTAKEVAVAVANMDLCAAIEVPFLNGFAFAIKTSVFSALGGLDTAAFPYGYGEEIDLCLRARNQGWRVVVDATSYVYHAKTQSYSGLERESLVARSQTVLHERWGEEKILLYRTLLRNNAELRRARISVRELLYAESDRKRCSTLPMYSAEHEA